MKLTNACPKCQSRVLWCISRAQIRLPDTQLVNVHVALGQDSESFFSRSIVAGHYEIWICDSCGFTESYAQNFRKALQLAANNPENGVTLVDRTTKQGPFR